MSRVYPNAWDFSNTDKCLTSPNRRYKIEYHNLYEIAMGAPLIGRCSLIVNNHVTIPINNSAGGPVVWSSNSLSFCLPIWNKQRSQYIQVFNLKENTKITYSKCFRVLEISEFKDSIINGVDSPIYKSSKVSFNLNTEHILCTEPISLTHLF